MRISTKGRYGLQIILELTLTGETLLTTREIAEKLNISFKYTEQIIGILTRSGFTRSQRGATGGYSLGKAPEDITVGEILRATEGDLYVVDKGDLPSEPSCVTNQVWEDIENAIATVADNITLRDLAEKQLESQNFTYII